MEEIPDNFAAVEFKPIPLEIEAEARQLIDIALEAQLSPEQHHRLETLVVGNPSVARLYLELVHLWYSVPLHVSRATLGINEADGDEQPPMDESMILPAMREVDFSDDDFALAPPSRFEMPRRKSSANRWIWRSAAVVALGSAVIWATNRGHETPPVAIDTRPTATVPAVVPVVITATAAMSSEQSAGVSPGTNLASGQALQWTGGAVELTFASGAVAVVTGPAKVDIIGANAMELEYGAVTAHVPVAARGFSVLSPGLSVVDRGTNFGVRAKEGEAGSEVHVFDGIVDAAGAGASGQATSAAVRVTAGNAVRHDIGGSGGPVTVPYQPTTFTRDIAMIRLPVVSHDTGAGLAAGDADPNWQIISVPGKPDWQPRAAVVVGTSDPMYTTEVQGGHWVGMNGVLDNQPTGVFAFRTTVDLSEFDPSSVTITAGIAGDDFVSDIKINGQSTGITTSINNPAGRIKRTNIVLPAKAFQKGVNQVDVLVTNLPNNNPSNCMLLHMDWKLTACAAVRRKP